jgi:hypothetical protein
VSDSPPKPIVPWWRGRAFPQRLLGVAALFIFLTSPLYESCSGYDLLDRFGRRVVTHALDNPAPIFDRTAPQGSRLAATNNMADRGVFLVLLAAPLAAAALALVPRGRWPRAAALVALPGTAAAAATMINSAMGLVNWEPFGDPGVDTSDKRILVWFVWNLPSGVPLLLLPFAMFAVAKRRAWARRIVRTVALLAVVLAPLAPHFFGREPGTHVVRWGAMVTSGLLGLALYLEAAALRFRSSALASSSDDASSSGERPPDPVTPGPT